MLGGVERLRRPEYTGENRCTPCAILNTLIGAVGSVALGVVVSPSAGVLAFGVSVALVYVRGYLIPGTPTITARYFPRWLLAAFGKEPRETVPDDVEDESDPLKTSGVVESAGPGDDRLAPAFRTAWNERVRKLRGTGIGSERVADIFGVEPSAVSEMGENEYVIGNDRLVGWPSDAALLADVAAESELRARRADWDELSADETLQRLTRLRTLRDECPDCGEPLSTSERTVTSCCQPSVTVVSVTCHGCGAPIAETRRE